LGIKSRLSGVGKSSVGKQNPLSALFTWPFFTFPISTNPLAQKDSEGDGEILLALYNDATVGRIYILDYLMVFVRAYERFNVLICIGSCVIGFNGTYIAYICVCLKTNTSGLP
jgi:hypothetical protein